MELPCSFCINEFPQYKQVDCGREYDLGCSPSDNVFNINPIYTRNGWNFTDCKRNKQHRDWPIVTVDLQHPVHGCVRLCMLNHFFRERSVQATSKEAVEHLLYTNPGLLRARKVRR